MKKNKKEREEVVNEEVAIGSRNCQLTSSFLLVLKQ